MQSRTQPFVITGACFAAAVIAVLIAISYGSTGFPTPEAWSLSWLWNDSSAISTEQTVLWLIRAPRVAAAAAVGWLLGSAGVLSQGLFRNALASPSLLGVTSGAGFAAALALYLGIGFDAWYSLPLWASGGALLSTCLVLGLTWQFRYGTTEQLLLAGFALNAMLGALTTLIISLLLEEHQRAPAALYWLMGNLTARNWEHVLMAIVPGVAAFLGARLICPQLDGLALGERVAESLGIPTKALRLRVIIFMSVSVGAAVAVAGAIPFVGLMSPHISRMLVGPTHRRLLWVSGLNGVTLVVTCDLLARSIRAPAELQVGVVLALVGAPFFLWLWYRQLRQRHML